MSDIEQRAWDALIKAKKEEGDYLIPHKYCVKAMCREIEAHDATKAELADFKREVSDAVKELLTWASFDTPFVRHRLDRFIQPDPVKVDPLVEALRDWSEIDMGFVEAESLRAALAKRGLTITEGDAK